MKKVKPNPEFVALEEDEIVKALDAYEAQFGDDDADSDDGDLTPADPVVAEVARLISEYTGRFDEYCERYEELPEEVLNYEPESAIERIAFEIFTDAVHDALQAEDDE